MSKIAVIVPCYKRPEYTARCLKALEEAQAYGPNVTFFMVDDGSNDGTDELIRAVKLPAIFTINEHNTGLRSVLLYFFKLIMSQDYKYIVKMDSDCLVPKNWLNDIVEVLESGWADVVSPNVLPSNAALKHGKEPEPDKPGVRPSAIVGGLWAMKASLLEGIQFEEIETNGLTGAFSLLEQVIVEKEPRVGWLENVVVQDIGHWSGQHPDHIRSEEHREYSAEVGRRVTW